MDPVSDLLRFIDASPSPMHAADAVVADLAAAGFQRLDLARPAWDVAPGRYLLRRGASVVAFVRRAQPPKRFRLIGAHTDSPHLRLRPRAPFHAEGCRQLAIEVYGGALWNSWLDRDLGLAGTLHAADGSERRVRIHRAVARVVQLAIHLDRKVNDEGLKLNPQLHLAPVWGLAKDKREADEAFRELLAQESGLAAKDIVAHDLSLYDVTPSARGGAEGELIFAPRLDNLASCHAGMRALIAAAAGGDDATLPVLACFDHEEVGSTSDTGADGALLAQALERVALACGLDRAGFLAALSGSVMLSADMAHAVHPNYAERHEPRHRPRLGDGPVLKTNVNQRYATSAAGAAAVRVAAERAGVPLQDFSARGDIGCGSTIGPSVAANLGIAVVDLGAPMWSMHSARECAASADVAPYQALLTAHLRG